MRQQRSKAMAVFEKQTTGTINAPELAKSEERQIKFYADLLTTVGLDPKDAGGSINFTGPSDPIYDSPYYLAEGMSAILGAIGTAVAQIWKMRGGEEQDVTVDRKSTRLNSSHRCISYAVF